MPAFACIAGSMTRSTATVLAVRTGTPLWFILRLVGKLNWKVDGTVIRRDCSSSRTRVTCASSVDAATDVEACVAAELELDESSSMSNSSRGLGTDTGTGLGDRRT